MKTFEYVWPQTFWIQFWYFHVIYIKNASQLPIFSCLSVYIENSPCSQLHNGTIFTYVTIPLYLQSCSSFNNHLNTTSISLYISVRAACFGPETGKARTHSQSQRSYHKIYIRNKRLSIEGYWAALYVIKIFLK